MNLLSAAERLAAVDRSNVALDISRCLHAVVRLASCDACFQVCPVEALQGGPVPILDEKRCVNCLACLPACPTGAFSADDEVQALATCAARLENKSVEILCGKRTYPHISCSEEAALLQLRGCMAGLGAGGYLALAALGIESISVRLEACAACSWDSLESVIEGQLLAAQRHLEAWGSGCHLLRIVSFENQGAHERAAWDVHNPPLSRRDLFRMASRQGQIALARAMEAERPTGGKRVSKERTRISNALRRLACMPAVNQDCRTDGLGYGWVTVNETCSACGVCARACPTGALSLEIHQEVSFTLDFQPQLCIGCEICAQVCASGAMKVDHQPGFRQVFDNVAPVTLASGELTRCRRCKVTIAKRQGGEYCPLCEFRRKNPFGSSLPPGLQALFESKQGRKNL